MILANLFRKFFTELTVESMWLDNWVCNAEYVNISVYSPLSGSTYIKLSCEMKNSMKDLIITQNNDNAFFAVMLNM